MSIVRLQNVSKAYGGFDVLRSLDFRVEQGEKIGLIGRNGSGKSTLFKLLTGEIDPDAGTLERMRRAKLASVAQIPTIDPDTQILDIVLARFSDLMEMEARLGILEENLAVADPETIEEYSRLGEQFSLHGGYRFRADAKRVLTGLGFGETEFTLPFHALSGGQRTRLTLAVALLDDADLLLLDEPENHLDLQAREWLEKFLKDWETACVIISHDRQMLNAVAGRIVEIKNGRATSFTGNYEAFIEHQALELEKQRSQYKRQQHFVEREEAWINRFRYKNTKSRQVQSRIKRLKKMERLENPAAESSAAPFRLGNAVRSGQKVLEARGLSMRYGELVLYDDLSFDIERGERVGIIGPNGSGKTTLLRHLAGRLDAPNGNVSLGHKVDMAYFDQHQEDFDPNADLLTQLQNVRPDLLEGQVRSYLGRFLFSGEDVFKSVDTLSGGERTRLALAKLILGGANLLLLDEPTNHLDIASRESLEQSLEEHDGSILIVSHDRILIDRLVDKLIIIENGSAHVHLGNYTHYKWKMRENGEDRDLQSRPDAMTIRKKGARTRESRKEAERNERGRKKRLNALETSIADTERSIEDYGQRFADAEPADHELLQRLKSEYETLQGDLRAMYEEWDDLADTASPPSDPS